jgi:hypothetical protein
VTAAARRCATASVGLVALLAPPASAAQVTVDAAPASVRARLGGRFTVRTTVVNRGAGSAAGLVAHLNVLSVRPGVYVDPEDWSSDRTRYLPALAAGASATQTWQLQAVSAGSFAVYVAVLGARGDAARPVPGPAVRVAVAERQSLDTGGVLPLALGVPGLLGALTLGLRLRRRP